jgi:hypothetical protein
MKAATFFSNAPATQLNGFAWIEASNAWAGFVGNGGSNFLLGMTPEKETIRIPLRGPAHSIILTASNSWVLVVEKTGMYFLNLENEQTEPFTSSFGKGTEFGFAATLHPGLIGTWMSNPDNPTGKFNLVDHHAKFTERDIGIGASAGFTTFRGNLFYPGPNEVNGTTTVRSYPLRGPDPKSGLHFRLRLPPAVEPKMQARVSAIETDAEGNFWLAFYGAGMVVKYTAYGVEREKFVLPDGVEVTSLSFGGPELRTLLIGVSDSGPEKEAEGQFFTIETAVGGKPAELFRAFPD